MASTFYNYTYGLIFFWHFSNSKWNIVQSTSDSCKNMCNWVAEAAVLADCLVYCILRIFFMKSFGSLKFSVVYVIAQCNNFAETVFMLRAKITNTKLRVTHVCTPLLRQFWKRIAPICLKEDFKKKLTTFFNEHFGGKLHHENFPR